jgi:hypothetical protein
MSRLPKTSRRSFLCGVLVIGSHIAITGCVSALRVPSASTVGKKAKREALFLYCYHDYGCGWRAAKSERPLTVQNSNKVGVNLATCAAAGRKTLTFGIVRHDSTKKGTWESWNHHPEAYDNLKQEVLKKTDIETFEIVRVKPETDDLSKCDILFLSGHNQVGLSDGDIIALKNYLSRGGVFVIDNCAASDTFDKAAREAIQRMYSDTTVKALPADHPFFSAHYKLDGSNSTYTPEGIGTQWSKGKPIEFVAIE